MLRLLNKYTDFLCKILLDARKFMTGKVQLVYTYIYRHAHDLFCFQKRELIVIFSLFLAYYP